MHPLGVCPNCINVFYVDASGKPIPKTVGQDAYRVEEYRRFRIVNDYDELIDSIDDALELAPLHEIASQSHVAGVARLYELPTFAPEDVTTCVFFSTGIRLDLVRNASSMQLPDSPPFDPLLVRRHTFRLRYPSLGPFLSWTRFCEHAVNAKACSTTMIDGGSYRHAFHDGNRLCEYKWSNPCADAHPQQCDIISGYEQFVRSGWLRSWIPDWRFWRVRNRAWGP